MQNNNDDDESSSSSEGVVEHDDSSTSSSEGVIEQDDDIDLGFNTGISALMEVVEQNKSNLCDDKYSPLEMVCMMRADLNTVKRIYEMHPPALNGKLLVNVCCHGAQPGVIGFLSEKLPGAIKNPDEDDCLPLELAMGQEAPGPGRPTEAELRTMIEIYPQGLSYGKWNTYLSVLCWRYSLQFTDYVFRKMAVLGLPDDELYFCHHDDNNRDALDYRNQIDMDCVQAMAHVLPCISSVNIQDMPWHVDALCEFLKLVTKNSNIKQLHLHSPCEQVEDLDQLERSIGHDRELLPAVKKSLLAGATKSGLESLVVSFNDDDDPFFPFLLGDFACKIPKLQRLCFFADHSLELITPTMVQLLSNSKTLTHLEFLVYPVDSMIQGDLTGLIDAIANNKVLKSFKYTEDDCDDSQIPAIWHKRVAAWIEYAAKALENNITIETFQIMPCDANEDSDNTLTYYTRLNRYGRAIARKSDTTLEQLVSLLVGIGTDDLQYYYGLLRESPGCWSVSGSCTRAAPAAAAVPPSRRKKSSKRRGTVVSKGGQRRSSARLAKRQRSSKNENASSDPPGFYHK